MPRLPLPLSASNKSRAQAPVGVLRFAVNHLHTRICAEHAANP